MIRRALPACAFALLAACASAPQPGDELVLDAGQPREGWHITLADFETQVRLAGDSASVPKLANPKVPDSVVSVRRGSRSGRSDALTMAWNQAWYASLRFEGGPPLDLRRFVDQGTLEFDIDVVEMARGGLTFTMGCGKNCSRKLPYMLPSRALQGQGWKHLSFALRCFVRDGDDLSAVSQAFTMDSSGSGEAAIAHLRFVRQGRPNAPCPDYRTQSVTPEPLTQVWALDWWMPRHQKKLDEIAARRAQGQGIDVVFIGDSITHGWEDVGAPVWQRQFAPRGALNLGYGGDKTENVLWRLQHGELDGYAPKAVVLMIGTNNTGDRLEDPLTTVAGIRRIVDEIRSRQPQAKVLLLAVFPRDEKPDSPLRLNNDRINRLLPALADGRRVVFLDIGSALMNADGTLSREVMPDLLHLSEKGYAQWARAIAPTLASLLGPTPATP